MQLGRDIFNSGQRSIDCAEVFVAELVCRHGAPKLSEQGREFVNKIMAEVCRILNVRKVNTSITHDQIVQQSETWVF